ncbi:MAG: RHS repeat-associated core domain-containing protein, partial [Verrucomicrobiae bacterium]|nr:RHS repeat-associated core domain-containing protein [Verrucomicrobiae bacterium]
MKCCHQRTKHTRPDSSHLTFSYDPIGQLTIVRATNSGGTILGLETKGYLYDAAWNLNRRTNNSSGSSQPFNVDGKNQLTSEPGMTDAYDANGNLTNRNDGSYYYGYSYTYNDENRLNRTSYRSQSGQEANWRRTVFTYDGLGRLAARNRRGNMAASYRYDPYGNTITSSGVLSSVNKYRFSSKELMAGGVNGLYYYGYRFYDPVVQRWLNRDPIGEGGGINLYGLVANDPIGRIDPSGLDYRGYGYECAKQCERQLTDCLFDRNVPLKAGGVF